MAIKNLRGISELARIATGTRRKEVLEVQLDEVVSKAQVRKRFRKLKELADTLKSEGQQSPIIVYPKNTDGKYVIQKGERRWRAMSLAGYETIEVIINEKLLSGLDETAGELIENIQRDDLTPMEIAEALQEFVDEGWAQKDIAKRIGKSAAFVSTHLSLLKSPDCVLSLHDEELCGDTETLNNLRQLYDIDPHACLVACEKAAEDGGISRKESRELLNLAKGVGVEPQGGGTSPFVGTEDHQYGLLEGGDDGASEAAEGGGPEIGFHNEVESSAEDEELPGEDEPRDTVKLETPKTPSEPKNLDAMPAVPGDRDWSYTEPESLIVVVNVEVDGEVKRGILQLDRVGKEPGHAWVKIGTGPKGLEEKIIKMLACDVELVSLES